MWEVVVEGAHRRDGATFERSDMPLVYDPLPEGTPHPPDILTCRCWSYLIEAWKCLVTV